MRARARTASFRRARPPAAHRPPGARVSRSPRAAGDYKFDPLGYATDGAATKEMQLMEVKNGRLAMIAFSGIVTQAALTGKGLPYF